MIVGVLKETCPGERRAAMVPGALAPLLKAGLEVRVETGAGVAAGIPDAEYAAKGAAIAARDAILAEADFLLVVRGPGAGGEAGKALAASLRSGQAIAGMMDPLSEPGSVRSLADGGVTAFALELLPRITRAQSMDVLSSMATVAGYQAVLLAASRLPRIFPMLMTAAGTLAPARVFVVGVGVAGLQAIATAKRLGAVVEAYDVRPAVKDQVISVGAKFVEFELETADAEDKGGYAKEQSDDFLRRQQEQMQAVVARNDVVITTAAIPGRKAPVLITEPMVQAMAPGSVIVDLAAERGGNCALTRADEEVVAHGVTILGPTDLPAQKAFHASQMYAKNTATFLLSLVKAGALALDREDEIVAGTLLTHGGEVVQPRVRELLGLGAPADDAGKGGE